jgi:hypothetical protein
MKKATVLNATKAFDHPSKKGAVLSLLEQNQFVEYSRAKYKDGTEWIEILLPDNSKAYVEAKDLFKWKLHKVFASSLTFTLDHPNSEGRDSEILMNGEELYRVMPELKKKRSDKAQEKFEDIAKVRDANGRLGTVKGKHLRQTGIDFVLLILAVVLSTVGTITIAVYAVVGMIMGGRILVGGIVILALLFVWRLLLLLAMLALQKIRKGIYQIAIRF